jgi:hypothetical protein
MSDGSFIGTVDVANYQNVRNRIRGIPISYDEHLHSMNIITNENEKYLFMLLREKFVDRMMNRCGEGSRQKKK